MRRTQYIDEDGRKWAVDLPDGVSDESAAIGVPAGPPSLASLDLPLELEVRLHNQLFDRAVLTARDAKVKRESVLSAIQHALKLDVQKVIAVYNTVGAEQPPQVLESPVEE